jgi:metallo-beta-lactamase family protein
MQLSFFGATREVTGSCFMLETKAGKLLVDCGMFQGSNFNEGKNHDAFQFDPKEIQAILVTHAHLDHIGRIPKLVRDGFNGKIFMTKATRDFAILIWEDALHVMKENNEKHKTPILYSEADISLAYSLCEGLDYHQTVEVLSGVKAIWKDAGHIFGAGFIELEAEGKRICFSGDVGNEEVPILRDTEPMGDADILLLESTYGDRVHESVDVRRELILDLIKHSVENKGAIMIPAFSLERTQELLYELNILSEYEKSLPQMPIFLDSPLAIRASAVYERYPEYYDEEAKRLHDFGDDFLDFSGLRMTLTKEESKVINNTPGPKMIIAGSGMMNGGRIVHHAFRYLSDPASTLLIVGYQAEGTLGRRLYEGATKVKVFGEDVYVKCKVKAVGALSAHGDQPKLIKWVGTAKKTPQKIFCVHGEPHAATELAHRLRDVYNVEALVPEMGECVEI